MDLKGAWEQAKENLRRLRACPRHRFASAPKPLGSTYTCLECKGTMRLSDIGSYIAGYEAHGGNADDIFQGWRKPGA